MKSDELLEFGFSPSESKIYIYLLKHGDSKVGSIIRGTGLQSSSTHNSLNSLSVKGFVGYIIKDKIKIYHAVEPQIISENLKEKQRKFSDVLPELEALSKSIQRNQFAEIYEGERGVYNMIKEFVRDAKKGEDYYFFSVDVPGHNTAAQDFFGRYEIRKKLEILKVKGLAREDLRKLFLERPYLNVKFVKFPIPANMSICNDKMIIINWGENKSGILIKSEQIIESTKIFFLELYKNAKK